VSVQSRGGIILSKARRILSIMVGTVLFQEARRPVVPLRDESISVAAIDQSS
jgi:hypothetical protein